MTTFAQPAAERAAIAQPSNPGAGSATSGLQLGVSNGAIGAVGVSANARHIGAPSNSTAGAAPYALTAG